MTFDVTDLIFPPFFPSAPSPNIDTATGVQDHADGASAEPREEQREADWEDVWDLSVRRRQRVDSSHAHSVCPGMNGVSFCFVYVLVWIVLRHVLNTFTAATFIIVLLTLIPSLYFTFHAHIGSVDRSGGGHRRWCHPRGACVRRLRAPEPHPPSWCGRYVFVFVVVFAMCIFFKCRLDYFLDSEESPAATDFQILTVA